MMRRWLECKNLALVHHNDLDPYPWQSFHLDVNRAEDDDVPNHPAVGRRLPVPTSVSAIDWPAQP